MVKYEEFLRPEMNEVVKEVREMRMKISEKCGHDLNALPSNPHAFACGM